MRDREDGYALGWVIMMGMVFFTLLLLVLSTSAVIYRRGFEAYHQKQATLTAESVLHMIVESLTEEDAANGTDGSMKGVIVEYLSDYLPENGDDSEELPDGEAGDDSSEELPDGEAGDDASEELPGGETGDDASEELPGGEAGDDASEELPGDEAGSASGELSDAEVEDDTSKELPGGETGSASEELPGGETGSASEELPEGETEDTSEELPDREAGEDVSEELPDGDAKEETGNPDANHETSEEKSDINKESSGTDNPSQSLPDDELGGILLPNMIFDLDESMGTCSAEFLYNPELSVLTVRVIAKKETGEKRINAYLSVNHSEGQVRFRLLMYGDGGVPSSDLDTSENGIGENGGGM